jgi:hypothetical protein
MTAGGLGPATQPLAPSAATHAPFFAPPPPHLRTHTTMIEAPRQPGRTHLSWRLVPTCRCWARASFVGRSCRHAARRRPLQPRARPPARLRGAAAAAARPCPSAAVAQGLAATGMFALGRAPKPPAGLKLAHLAPPALPTAAPALRAGDRTPCTRPLATGPAPIIAHTPLALAARPRLARPIAPRTARGPRCRPAREQPRSASSGSAAPHAPPAPF